MLLAFYSYIQRYMQPHQKNVTQILAYMIQASHVLVLPEEIAPILRILADNFVNERSGSEVMSVGLNTIRELVTRVPLVTEQEGVDDLMADLIEYKSYRKDKSVMMAARSLLNELRTINPTILARKERGKFHDAKAKPLEYGQMVNTAGIDGLDLLEKEQPGISGKTILTDADFKRIKELKKLAELEKLDPAGRRKYKRAKLGMKTRNGAVYGERPDSDEEEQIAQVSLEDLMSDSDDDSDDENLYDSHRMHAVVDPATLHGNVKRKKMALAERLESVHEGRDMAVIDKNRTGGISNKEKEKTTKNYLMVSKSNSVVQKSMHSLKQQQHTIKRHVKTLEKRKKTVQKVCFGFIMYFKFINPFN